MLTFYYLVNALNRVQTVSRLIHYLVNYFIHQFSHFLSKTISDYSFFIVRTCHLSLFYITENRLLLIRQSKTCKYITLDSENL